MTDLGPSDVPFTNQQRDALLLRMDDALLRIENRIGSLEVKIVEIEREHRQHSKDIAGFKSDRERAKWWTRTVGGAAIVAFIGTAWGIITGKH